MRRRILYVQYTNPAGYPPLEHSSGILAENGWDVVFLGVGSGESEEFAFPVRPGVTSHLRRACAPGLRQKLHYLGYCLWVLAWSVRTRPHLIYASDRNGCLPALVASWISGSAVIYHEHDSPDRVPASLFDRVQSWARRRLSARSLACVLPSQGRIPEFLETTGVAAAKVHCVWNCPRRHEVQPVPPTNADEFILYYHGSINRQRLPPAIIEAIALLPRVRLRIVGYETMGSRGYLDELRSLAETLGVAGRVEYAGLLRTRSEILAQARGCQLGLSFMPAGSEDINMRHMVGASNKPFDYLACGMALLVSALPDWHEFFVKPGYALDCDPQRAQSVADAIAAIMSDPRGRAEMARGGQEQVLAAWLYDIQFAPVLARIDERTACGS